MTTLFFTFLQAALSRGRKTHRTKVLWKKNTNRDHRKSENPGTLEKWNGTILKKPRKKTHNYISAIKQFFGNQSTISNLPLENIHNRIHGISIISLSISIIYSQNFWSLFHFKIWEPKFPASLREGRVRVWLQLRWQRGETIGSLKQMSGGRKKLPFRPTPSRKSSKDAYVCFQWQSKYLFRLLGIGHSTFAPKEIVRMR